MKNTNDINISLSSYWWSFIYYVTIHLLTNYLSGFNRTPVQIVLFLVYITNWLYTWKIIDNQETPNNYFVLVWDPLSVPSRKKLKNLSKWSEFRNTNRYLPTKWPVSRGLSDELEWSESKPLKDWDAAF